MKVASGVVAVSAGFYTTCTIDVSHQVLCWGDDSSGQLGIAPAQAPITQCPATGRGCDPTAHTIHDADGSPFDEASELAVGSSVCAIKTDGSLWCWGAANTVGDGRPFDDAGVEAAPQLTAVRVAGLPPP